MPFRIAIDARPFAGPPCGYTVYLGSVLGCLRRGDFDVTLLSDKPLHDRYVSDIGDAETLVFGRRAGLGWEQADLPTHLAARSYDLYLSAANRGIPLTKSPHTRYLLVLYDVIPYIFFRDYYLRRWRDFLRQRSMRSELTAQLIAVLRADAILTISRQSAVDIRRIFFRRAVTPILIRLRDVEERKPTVPEPQFVYVGGTDFRKRLDTLLRGFALFRRHHPNHRLVLVGWNYARVNPLIEELGLEQHVVLTGYVNEDVKFGVLGESLAMVYPSLYEGYGLAISEGFQARIPVIAGTGGSQREVGGTGVRPIDPRSPEDVAIAMEEMLDPITRAEWISRGDAQLARLRDPAIDEETLAYFVEQARLARDQES